MRVFLHTLFFVLISAIGLNAQSVWTGAVDSDWQNAGNWVGGVPTSGVTATLPGTPQGGNFPIFSGGPVLDYNIQNAGTLTFNSLVYNSGDLINFVGGTIINEGQFYNSGNGTIDNDGFFNNNGVFINYGSYDAALSGETTVAAGATFTHAGSFFKSAGPFINNGTVINTANMRSTNLFDNMGSLINKNSFESPFGSTFNLHGSGSLVNEAGTVFVINGAFTFDAGFTNDGTFSLQSAAIGNAMMPIFNNGDFEVSGTLNNQSTFTNNSTLAILDGGEMTNSSVLENNGTITLAICGALVQNANNTIQAPVLNDGLIYILSGDVDWTNIEFGNEFSDLNQTKPPVAGCINGFVYLDENGQGTLTPAAIDKGSYGACGASIANLSLSKTEYTTADIGSSTVTLTVEDNLGVISTCEGIVSVFAYVPPVVPVDDPSITFECPADVTASTLPGANTTVVTWTEPTDATSDCQGATACADRVATNTTQCSNGVLYGFYLKLEGQDYQYAIADGSFKEYEDGSATFTAHVTNNGDASLQFDLIANLSGRTFVAPAGSPKEHACLSVDYSDWYYYENLTGSLTGTNALAGASIALNTFGASFQVGTGANVTSATNDFGASGWLSATINTQPNNGPNLVIENVGNGQSGDINIMLSGNSSSCAPAVQCSAQTEIPGFIYMGEYNNSKYYCSNTNNFTWSQAKAAAEAGGGHLAVVEDIEENNFLQSNIIADYAWIGLTDEASEGTFEWVIPGASNFFNWNAGEPNNSGGNEDYVRLLKSNGKWTDRSPSFLAEFIMEIPCSNGPASCEAVADNKAGFTFLGEFNSSKYYVSHSASSWTTAQADCEANGGHLASIEDLAENDFIQSNINPASGSVWTGLNTVSSPGAFNWVSGQSVDYLNWSPGEPNANGVDQAARLKKADGLWTDRHISTLYEYVLEVPCSTGGGGGPAGPPAITQISGPANGAAFFAGVTEVAYQVTDDCGNVEICIFNVDVEATPSDITLFDCPNDIIINTLPGATSAIIDWTAPTASTTCYNDGLVLRQTEGPNVGDVLRVKDGPQQVAYVATDSCNNFQACVFNVQVIATPSAITMANCPGDISITPEAGANSATVNWSLPTATTTCYTDMIFVEQVAGPAPGSTLTAGTSETVIYILNDECGNSEICIFTVAVDNCPAIGTACDDGDNTTVNDQEDGNCNCAGEPSFLEIDCGSDISIATAPGETDVMVTFDLPTVANNCPDGYTLEQLTGGASGTNFPIGITTVSFSATDECGNTANCSFDVAVAGGTSTLTVDCLDDIVVNAAPGAITALVDWDDPVGSTDCASGNVFFILEQGGGPGFNYPLGTSTIEYNFYDECGASVTCQFTVTVNDGGCVDADGDGICAGDDCDDNDASLPAAAGTACDDGDASTINDVIGADGCSCSGVSTTLDISCPADIYASSEPGAFEVNVSFDTPTVTGICPTGYTLTQISGGLPSGTNYPEGVFDVSYEATDDCGNSANCSFQIFVTLIDAVASITCPADITVSASNGSNGSIVNYDLPTGSSDCVQGYDGSVELIQGYASGEEFPIGVTEVMYSITDNCGSISSCFFQVTVEEEACTDADGDGICAADDCDDNDASLPAAAGTACDDGDASTENDMIGADGCSCAGTPINNDPDCNDIQIVPGNSSITISGLTAPVTTIQVFNASWSEVFKCAGNCDPNVQVITGLSAETHFVKVAFYTANWQPICSVEDYYQVTAGDPCENAGGDADGDGVCAADDCDDNDASLPAAEGSACDDGDATTINDAIGADGCSCAGVPDTGNPCDYAGGDADGDGVCADDDCDDNDANYPMAPGTTCDDGDADTENDMIGADGCSCAGTPIVVGPDCANISITTGNGSIIVSGLDGAPISSVQIFDESWSQVFKCIADCGATETITGLSDAHNYFVKVAYYDASWNLICDIEEYHKVYADGSDPCENAGGDADGDGVCADTDCDDNNPNLPAAPGTACDDGDSATVNDAIGADGCSCAGEVPGNGPDCANIQIALGDGSITVSGLEFAPITSIQIFDATWSQVFKCAGDCEASTQVIDGLATGTYFVKVAYYDGGWNPICDVEGFHDVVSTLSNGPQSKVSVDFFVEKNERMVDVVWGSNRGAATEFFVIEKSLDGENFEELIRQENEYFGQATKFYTGLDEQPEEGWNYYRLKETMIDGSIEYSEARKVHFMADFEKIMLFPNPTIDVAYLHLKAFVDMDVNIHVYDNLGQLVLSQSIDRAPATPVELNITGLQAGTYHVSVKTDTRKRVTTKLVILRD